MKESPNKRKDILCLGLESFILPCMICTLNTIPIKISDAFLAVNHHPGHEMYVEMQKPASMLRRSKLEAHTSFLKAYIETVVIDTALYQPREASTQVRRNCKSRDKSLQ